MNDQCFLKTRITCSLVLINATMCHQHTWFAIIVLSVEISSPSISKQELVIMVVCSFVYLLFPIVSTLTCYIELLYPINWYVTEVILKLLF